MNGDERNNEKMPYICGPLSDLPFEPKEKLGLFLNVVAFLVFWFFKLFKTKIVFADLFFEEKQKERIKKFYERIADVCEKITGKRAFVPHEHFDPEKHAHFSPYQVDRSEREQICEHTSVLIVVAAAPSWGGGIEVEMANQSKVPVILFCDRRKIDNKKISRLLMGNPAIVDTILYYNEDYALSFLPRALHKALTPV